VNLPSVKARFRIDADRKISHRWAVVPREKSTRLHRHKQGDARAARHEEEFFCLTNVQDLMSKGRTASGNPGHGKGGKH